MLNDRQDFFEQGVNTLQKLTHQYHMHEIYAAAAPIYKRMKKNPPTDSELCGCVNDITGNGILTEMVHIAKQLKYFQQQTRMARRLSEHAICARCLGYESYSRTYICRRKRDAEYNERAKITQLEKEYLANPTRQTAMSLMRANPWKGNTLVRSAMLIYFQTILTKNIPRWVPSSGSLTKQC